MTEYGKKRRAEEQLSPYSQDLVDDAPATHEVEEKNIPSHPIARRRKDKDIDKVALKGVFGKISIGNIQPKELSDDAKQTIAGINRSFLKAVSKVLDVDSSKDLTYLFEQYKMFVEAVHKKIDRK